jgi:hypothetical protein
MVVSKSYLRTGTFRTRTKILYRWNYVGREGHRFRERRIKVATTGTRRGRIRVDHKSLPRGVTVAPENKLLVSREEAAQLSISQRGLNYLVASKRLPTRRIGGRVLIPVADLREYACRDHPERIVGEMKTC